jgi:transposase
VLPDADLDNAAEHLAAAAFGSTGGINASDIGKMLAVSRATVYRYLF